MNSKIWNSKWRCQINRKYHHCYLIHHYHRRLYQSRKFCHMIKVKLLRGTFFFFFRLRFSQAWNIGIRRSEKSQTNIFNIFYPRIFSRKVWSVIPDIFIPRFLRFLWQLPYCQKGCFNYFRTMNKYLVHRGGHVVLWIFWNKQFGNLVAICFK